ncbi:MAG: energy-coupling factor transport system ATP-binding protein [Actinomycetota bacterium]|nr:energy-coupling factor transport system ATP-binding protein [Actinomycetota bacterium]
MTAPDGAAPDGAAPDGAAPDGAACDSAACDSAACDGAACGGPSRGVRIRAEGWGWRHNGRLAWAVRGLDLTVPAGRCVLLLGPSGSGKSTLLSGLAGLLDPGNHSAPGHEPQGNPAQGSTAQGSTAQGSTARGSTAQGNGEQEGELLVDGVPARRARTAAVAGHRARTGLLLQDPTAQTVLSRCGDDVAFGLENHAVPREEIWPRVTAALNRVAFPYGREHATSHLSGGERQRLALAGVLVLRPGLLLLDEPTAMLDPQGADLLREEVGAVLRDGDITCVIVEHRVDRWRDLADDVVVLGPSGGVQTTGPVEEVFSRAGRRLREQGVWIPDPGLVPVPVPAPEPERAPEPLLLVRDLQVGRPRERPVLSGVELEICSGTALCLLGPNGSGKSTLALALAGLSAPLGGQIEATPALTRGLRRTAPHRWRPLDLLTRIGTVFQNPLHQFVATSVAEEPAVGLRLLGVNGEEIEQRVGRLLTRLRLDHLSRAHPYTLSGGEQRRLSVATALATRPSVLVLDEPTFGQDARTWKELVELFGELLGAGHALVVATHDLPLVRALDAVGRVRTRTLGP